MNGISGQNNDHVAVPIDQEELNLMKEKLQEKLQEEPKLLSKSAGNKKCCIFRVPRSLIEINHEAYRPQIVSIGPYHRLSQNKDLEMIQQHKLRFLRELLARPGAKDLESYLKLMLSMDSKIRQSYSESLDQFSKNELAEIMVLDGFFIIELFRKVGGVTGFQRDDPFSTMSWVSPFLMRDLLRLENQIPFEVLETLFRESKETCTGTNRDETLPMLTLKFFNYAVDRPPSVLDKYKILKGEHLLDFFRKSFIKDNRRNQNPAPDHPDLKLIPPATKLQVAGVKFKENLKINTNIRSFLDIKFDKGLLEIPQINMDDFYSSFLLNCVAFEQCYYHCSKDFTTYIIFMSCLINTPADAGLLSDKKIIENYFGTDKEVSEFFHKVGKDVAFDLKNNYLVTEFKNVNEYYRNGWHVGLAGFKHTYFESPWSFISALAAFMLLSLTVIQSFYTVYAYYHPRN